MRGTVPLGHRDNLHSLFFRSHSDRRFYGHWPSIAGSGEQTLIVEQVSHHPPITAYIIENKSKGLVLQGHNAQKTSFSSGTLIGKASL